MKSEFDEQGVRAAQVCFALASQLIYREPNEEQINQYIEHDVFAAAPFGIDNVSVVSGLEKLKAWCDKAAAEKAESQTEADNTAFYEEVSSLKNEWLYLFIGYGTPKAPSWEAYYRDLNSPLMGPKTLEVRAWYREYGLEIENLYKEPDDNLGLMLGFLSELLSLEADALCEADTAKATDLATAQKDFLSDHILPWLAAWHYKVREYARSDYYKGVGELVFGFSEELAKRYGISFNEEKEAFVYTA